VPAPEPTAGQPWLAASALACRRGGRLVFDGLDLALSPGEALVLRGPNGSGKSSLLRLLAGLLRPEAGRIAWAGQPIGADHRARLHFIAHGDALKPALTTRETLELAAALAGGPSSVGPALEALALTPLAEVPTRFLSAGQRRRAALARLLASPRPLWLLDEPGVGLDRASRDRLEAAIDRHRADGGIVVVATHGDVAVGTPLVLDFPG
jgi:heme exporter protein A